MSRGCAAYRFDQAHARALDFLTAEQRAAAEAEVKQLQAAEPWDAAHLLAATLEWARSQPDDPRVPEALHRAVIAARYRCADVGNRKQAKEAFQLLHRRYPNSAWTARTNYWY
jgi:hypothetical protein